METLSDGSCVFRNELNIEGEGVSPFTVGAGWLVEIIEIYSGALSFVCDDDEVRPDGKRFGAYYSRFSIIETSVKNNTRADVFGIGAFDGAPGLPSDSVLFETDFDGPFTSAAAGRGSADQRTQ